MHPVRKKRIITISVIFIILSTAIGFMMYALQQNINLFYSPTQISQGEAPVDTQIRAGGMVVEGSVSRNAETLEVSFDVTDYENTLTIRYKGILPDLFREGQGIVAQGKLSSEGFLNASEVLAKHDEEYMPPEIAEALKARPATSEKPKNSSY
jgi:cytochrome c-type biogenesis protein CcmE